MSRATLAILGAPAGGDAIDERSQVGIGLWTSSGLDQDPPQLSGSLLGDVPRRVCSALECSEGVARPRSKAISRRAPSDIPDFGDDGRRGDEPETGDRGKSRDSIVAPEHASELAFGFHDLAGHGIDGAEIGAEACRRQLGQSKIVQQGSARFAGDVGDLSMDAVLREHGTDLAAEL